MWKKIKPYIISVIISLGAGGLSALLTSAFSDSVDSALYTDGNKQCKNLS